MSFGLECRGHGGWTFSGLRLARVPTMASSWSLTLVAAQLTTGTEGLNKLLFPGSTLSWALQPGRRILVLPPDYLILYYTTLYHTTLYHTILYYTLLYYTILYYTILYYAMLCYAIPYHTIPYHTIPYHTIPYHTIPHHTTPYYTTLV